MAFRTRYHVAVMAALLGFGLGSWSAGAVVDTSMGVPVAGNPNLRLWLDASDLSTLWQDTAATTPATGGSSVALWQDVSGNAKHVSNPDASYRPVFASSVANLGGAAAVSFVGGTNGDMLFRGNDLGISGNADRTVVTVWTSTAFTSQNYQHTFHMGNQFGDQAYGHSAARGDGAGSPIGNHYWGGGFDSTATAALNTPRLAVSSWATQGGDGLDIWWIDGAAAGANPRVALNTGTNELKIGSRLNGGNAGNEGFTGHLAEVIVFSKVLSVAERSLLGSYIQEKYGFAVADAAVYRDIVFDDNFSGFNGATIHGKTPVIGGAPWNQTGGNAVTIQNNTLDTTGGARVIVGTFTEALGPNTPLTLTFDVSKLTSHDGFAGISLLEGGVEKLFVGNARYNSNWTMASSVEGAVEGTDMFSTLVPIGPGSALFTYHFDTGFSTLSIDESAPISGFLPAGVAIDGFRIWNNYGGDIAMHSITVTIPEPSALLLAMIGLVGLGLLGRRPTR